MLFLTLKPFILSKTFPSRKVTATSASHFPKLQVLVFQQAQADILAAMTQIAQNAPAGPNPVNKVLHAKDPPQFSVQICKDQLDFFTRFVMVGQSLYRT